MMNNILNGYLEGKQKTNLHTMLCLKRIFHDEGRALDQPFQQREISSMWQTVAAINPNFLNSGVAPVYITKQVFISRIEHNFYILEEYRNAFSQIDWGHLIQSVQAITPLFTPIHDQLLNDRGGFLNYAIQILQEPPLEYKKRFIPAFLEIFSYSVLKTHLKYYGADIFRWTRTNSNDGGVDMTCGDVSYSITTHLDYKKMDADASKQVRDRLNFVTIKNKVSADKILEIEEERGLSINIIELNDLIELIENFNALQKSNLLQTLSEEIQKEL